MKKRIKKSHNTCGKDYNVYSIIINGEILYIGRTDNLHRRELQHRNDFKKGKDKELYNYLRSINYTKPIELTYICSFPTLTDSKRYEAFLILSNYFTIYSNVVSLKQTLPRIAR